LFFYRKIEEQFVKLADSSQLHNAGPDIEKTKEPLRQGEDHEAKYTV